MEKIKIEPSGIHLSYLRELSARLLSLTRGIADCYVNDDFALSKDFAAKHIDRVNYLLPLLNFPEIEIDFDYIEMARKGNNKE
jgi:hypothetical protein